MTAAHLVPPRRRPSARVAALLAAIGAALLALVGIWLLARDLFVMTEARGYALYRPPIDALRFLLLPELDWGSGRLLGQLQFHATNAVCGVDAVCYNAVGAVETAVAAALLVLHTRQLSGSTAIALVAAAFWLTSPALLGVTVWQATRFDLLAFSFFLAALSAWWWALGRPRTGRVGAVAFAVGSGVLLCLAFNSKETTYALLVLLPVIAVLRGAAVPGGIRRNLALAAIPLAYGAWFVAWGMTHMDPTYASRSGVLSVLDGLAALLRAGLGIDEEFMYLAPAGGAAEAIAPLTAGWAIVGAVLLAAWAVALVRRRARRTAEGAQALPAAEGSATPAAAPRPLPERLRDLATRAAPELHLAAVTAVTLAILARSGTPAAYYLLLPTWALTTLLLLAIRRLGVAAGWPRALPVVVVGIWAVVHLATFAALVGPGSAYDQLQLASRRLRSVGATLRAVYDAGRPYGPVAWRTLESPPTEFLVLRDPGAPRPEAGGYPVGGDLYPYLLGDATWARRTTYLPDGTLDELLARPSAEHELVVAIDGDYTLRLVTYGGEPIVGPIR